MLSTLVVTVNGVEPVPLGHDLVGGATNEFHGVAVGAGNLGTDPTVFVSRQRTVNRAGMTERVTVQSYALEPVTCRIELRASCDLASIGAVREGSHPSPKPAQAGSHGLVWTVPGRCSVHISGSPDPATARTPPGA